MIPWKSSFCDSFISNEQKRKIFSTKCFIENASLSSKFVLKCFFYTYWKDLFYTYDKIKRIECMAYVQKKKSICQLWKGD